MTRVVSFSISDTLSRAASSGRHKMAMSAALRYSARAAFSLRRSVGTEMISRSLALGQQRPDLEPGRAVFAVDEDFRFHCPLVPLEYPPSA